ncbi:MAG: FAD-binding protein [Xanthomonadales bacterium]|nr:FAD-binding protein [Xanthomonadales bacterium]
MPESAPTAERTAAVRAELAHAIGAAKLLVEEAERLAYASDNSRREGMPDLVVLAESHDDVAAVATACHRHRVPLTARGRASNTTGAAIAAEGGVVLSFERMQRIIEIRPADRVAIVEPGVLNGDLQTAAASHGLFWAPDPTSAPYSTIGGNLACNAGGPRAVKYGATRDHVLALRAIDGRGRAFRCGAAVTKNSTGFDLARLLVGSEGTLALITEATLRLTPLPSARRSMRAEFTSVDAAAEAVARLMGQAEIPAALEFMDHAAVELVRARGVALHAATRALLLIDADGDAARLDDAVQRLHAAAASADLLGWDVARDRDDAERVWAARRALSPALRSLAPDKINEDVVVPVSRIPELVARVHAAGVRYHTTIVCFGHAGNGNLHVNLMYDGSDGDAAARAAACLDEVFAIVAALGGLPSGEHGIGVAKRAVVGSVLDPVTLELMRAIKAQFDPAGVLNPGKLLP